MNFIKNSLVHLAKAEVEMEKIEIKDEPAGEDCDQNADMKWSLRWVDMEVHGLQ